MAHEALRERESTYKLMISQLHFDGYHQIASQLAGIIRPTTACGPSNRLMRLVALGTQAEKCSTDSNPSWKGLFTEEDAPTRGLDLDMENESVSASAENVPEASAYDCVYVASHKGAARAAAFSRTGHLVATGAEDGAIKLIDIERAVSRADDRSAQLTNTPDERDENPVLRTLLDHTDEVTCLDFHPFGTVLASGSRDSSVKLYEFASPSARKATRTIHEASEVLSLAFHPSGDYMLVGCAQPTVRLYDVQTAQCFVSSNPREQHRDAVVSVRWNSNATQFATASLDGSFKIWDGVSCRCIQAFPHAHEGAPLCSVAFSRNGKYVLTSGMDSMVRLWEVSTPRCLITYTGAGMQGTQEHRTVAMFNHTEDYVFFPDERTGSLCCWDARTADRQRLLGLGHNSAVRCVVHSPVTSLFVSCGDDYRVRFWYHKTAAASAD